MSPISTEKRTRTDRKTERPKRYMVILINDDFTPREFVVAILKAVFRLSEYEAEVRMMAAHQKGAAMVGVYTREIAETRADEAVEMAQAAGFPLMFVTEPEE